MVLPSENTYTLKPSLGIKSLMSFRNTDWIRIVFTGRKKTGESEWGMMFSKKLRRSGLLFEYCL